MRNDWQIIFSSIPGKIKCIFYLIGIKTVLRPQLNHGIFHKRHPFTFTNLETKVIAGKNWDLTA